MKIGLIGSGIAIVAWLMAYAVYSKLQMKQEEFDSVLGNEFILDGDTLTIVSSSSVNDTYTLSSGVIIDAKLVNKNKE